MDKDVEIQTQQRVIDLLNDEKEGVLRDREKLKKELSEVQLDLKTLKHEKGILLAELEAEIKKK